MPDEKKKYKVAEGAERAEVEATVQALDAERKPPQGGSVLFPPQADTNGQPSAQPPPQEPYKLRGVLVKDPEIVALSDLAGVLDGLKDPAVRQRVIRWAVDRYGVASWEYAPDANGEAAS